MALAGTLLGGAAGGRGYRKQVALNRFERQFLRSLVPSIDTLNVDRC